MTKALINKETGLVSNPIFPCIKGEGLCKLRIEETAKFECLYKLEQCLFRVTKKGEKQGG